MFLDMMGVLFWTYVLCWNPMIACTIYAIEYQTAITLQQDQLRCEALLVDYDAPFAYLMFHHDHTLNVCLLLAGLIHSWPGAILSHKNLDSKLLACSNGTAQSTISRVAHDFLRGHSRNWFVQVNSMDVHMHKDFPREVKTANFEGQKIGIFWPSISL